MRVIAGSARRLLLKTIDGMETRPTTDRIKETLFNMLQNDLYGCTFLDLFAGSGGIGIEALSRGAKHAVFVEKNPKAAACIRENLRTTHLEEKATVMNCDVMEALARLEAQKKTFSYIFMDPPYDHLWEKKVLEAMARTPVLAPEGQIIVEASLDTGFAYAESLGLEIVRVKTYKTNQHVFLRKMTDSVLFS